MIIDYEFWNDLDIKKDLEIENGCKSVDYGRNCLKGVVYVINIYFNYNNCFLCKISPY